jgi:rhamnosyltransferase
VLTYTCLCGSKYAKLKHTLVLLYLELGGDIIHSDSSNYDVSVIIPTLNAAKHIEAIAESISAQKLHPREVLVIDSNSDDDTVNMANRVGFKVCQIDRSEFDHGRTRDQSLNMVSGEIVVFLTQDAYLFDENSLQKLVSALRENSVWAAFGRQIPRIDAPLREVFARNFNYPAESRVVDFEDLSRLGIKTFFFSDVFSAIKKEAYMKVGGFPSSIVTGEDMVLAAKIIRAGGKVAYVSDAMVWHSHDFTFSQQMKRYFDIGAMHSMFRWLRDDAPPEKEGFRYVRELMKFLWQQRGYREYPRVVLDLAARFIGYRLGLGHSKLPPETVRVLGSNKAFWVRWLNQ